MTLTLAAGATAVDHRPDSADATRRTVILEVYDYIAPTVDWGDGTAPAAIPQTTAPGAGGTPGLWTGTHQYAKDGNFTITSQARGRGEARVTVGLKPYRAAVNWDVTQENIKRDLDTLAIRSKLG